MRIGNNLTLPYYFKFIIIVLKIIFYTAKILLKVEFLSDVFWQSRDFFGCF